MRVGRELHLERRLKEVRLMESNIVMSLQQASDSRRDFETKAEDAASKALSGCLAELTRTVGRQRTVHEEYVHEMSEEVGRISAALESQRISRKERGEHVSSLLEAELQKIREDLSSEQHLRFEAEGTMLRMMEDLHNHIREEVQQERVQREAVQGKLLGLLEDTCNRIEASFSLLPQCASSPARLGQGRCVPG